MTKSYSISFLLGLLLFLSASPPPLLASHHRTAQTAIAIISPTQGNQAQGQLVFTQMKKGVKVEGNFKGLSANSKHGFHIHEYGDRSLANGKSAGSHYNPDNHPHGLPPSHKRHAGSFGNLVTDKNGNATFSFVDPTISISGKNPILGRAVIIHARKDDGSQPLGNAGPRIGIGVIGIKNPKTTALQ